MQPQTPIRHGTLQRCLPALCTAVWLLAGCSPAAPEQGEQSGVAERPEQAYQVDTLVGRAEARLETHPAEALHLAEEALALAQRTGDRGGEAMSLRMIGLAHGAAHLFEQAPDYLARALRLFEALRDQAGIAQVTNELGHVYYTLGDSPQALRLLLRAWDEYGRLDDKEGMGAASNGIGLVYDRQENEAQALHYYRRSVDELEASGNREYLAKAYNNLGNILRDVGAYDEALAHLQRTLAFFEEAGDQRMIAIAHNNIGVALNRSGRSDEALTYLQRARHLVEEIGSDPFLLSAVYEELGLTYSALGRLDLALAAAQQSLALGEQAEDVYQVQAAREALARVHAARGEYEQAYVHHQRYSTVRDSLFGAETAETISRMETRHEMENMEQEIESLNQQSRIQTLQAQQQRGIRNVLLAGLVAGLLVVGLLYNRYRLKQRANHLLRMQKEEIQRSVEEKNLLLKELHHRVKNNLQVIASLLNLQSDALDDPAALAANREMRSRVEAMALIHRRLYREEHLARVDMQGYFEELSGFLLRSYNGKSEAVCCRVQAGTLTLNADTAVTLGLIVNELLTNALEHAFPNGSEGKVEVALKERQAGRYELTVADDGVGLATDGRTGPTCGLGFTLIEQLAHQLDGVIEARNGVGMSYTIRFEAINNDQPAVSS